MSFTNSLQVSSFQSYRDGTRVHASANMSDPADVPRVSMVTAVRVEEVQGIPSVPVGSAAPARPNRPTNLWEGLRVYVWYKRRRKTRKSRVVAAAGVFSSVVAALKPSDVCIDCGANVGRITRVFAHTGATVHAFEPDPDAFEVLSREVGSLPNVILHNAAVGVGDGLVKLYREKRTHSASEISSGSSTVEGKINNSSETFVLVEQLDFAAVLSQICAPIAIIKIDIEGGELAVLTDMLDRGLHTRAGHIFVETHEKQIPRLRKGFMQLEQRCRSMANIHLDWW